MYIFNDRKTMTTLHATLGCTENVDNASRTASGVFRNLETGGHVHGHKKFDDLFWAANIYRPVTFSNFQAQIRPRGGHPPFHLSSSPSKNFPISQRGGHGTMAPPPLNTPLRTAKQRQQPLGKLFQLVTAICFKTRGKLHVFVPTKTIKLSDFTTNVCTRA
jgi:hypothetical protein